MSWKPGIFICILLVCFSEVWSQDQHFSQFFAAPLNLNPALAGSYDGSFRVGAIYRDQWRTALGNAISTYGVGGDIRYENPWSDKKNPDFASIGFQFYGDRAQLYDLNTNQISLFFAYHKALDYRTRQYLSLGFQLGIAQKNINYENLIFGDQFNNIDDYTFESGEILPINNFAYGDYAWGLHYTISPNKTTNFNAGYSMTHFHTPNISFYRSANELTPDLIRNNELFIKHAVYLNTSFELDYQLEISPRLLFLSQGPHQELNIGASLRFGRDDFVKQGFHLGAFLRPVHDISGYNLDALVLLTGFEYSNMLIGLSYDLNLRDIIQDQKGIGVFEFSISYIGEYENDFTFCPKF